MTTHILIRSLDRGATLFLIVVAAIAILVPILNLAISRSSAFHIPTYLVALFGKYACVFSSSASASFAASMNR